MLSKPRIIVRDEILKHEAICVSGIAELVPSEVRNLLSLLTMTWFAEYLRLFCQLLSFPILFARVAQNLLTSYES